jgi:hypothetical protein
MSNKIYEYYLRFSEYTNPGLYEEYLKNELPDDIKEISDLVRSQLIHRVILKNGNAISNSDLRYGDMNKVPSERLRCEDDLFPTASAMLAELFRRDKSGIVLNRSEKDRLILTCRFISILMVSILKSKGIPCRVRSGFANYIFPKVYADHWINQYYDKKTGKWITIDVDSLLEDIGFNPLNIQDGVFTFSADAWLKVRRGEIDGKFFWNAGGFRGLQPVAWELFYDFHCLMNCEIIYSYTPAYIYATKFKKLQESELREIDNLAELMLNPDKNFDELQNIWNINTKFRQLKGGLL